MSIRNQYDLRKLSRNELTLIRAFDYFTAEVNKANEGYFKILRDLQEQVDDLRDQVNGGPVALSWRSEKIANEYLADEEAVEAYRENVAKRQMHIEAYAAMARGPEIDDKENNDND